MESLAVTETEDWLNYEVLGLAVSLAEAHLARAELPSHSLPPPPCQQTVGQPWCLHLPPSDS